MTHAFLITAEKPIGPLAFQQLIEKIKEQPGFSLFDFEKTKGSRHVWAAIFNALRRQQNNDLRAKSIETEFILLLSGERQIIKSQKQVGISEETIKLGVVIWDSSEMEKIIDSVIQVLNQFQITHSISEISMSEDNGVEEDLAIERTTMSNLK